MSTPRPGRAFIEALPPVICSVAWVVAAGVLAWRIPYALGSYRRLAEFLVFAVALLGGIGGLVGFWYSAASIEFLVRGYRVRVTAAGWVYEERQADGSVTPLPLEYTALANGYGPPCRVALPSAEQWDALVPSWARGRREQIVRNIAKDLGAEFRTVEFTDAQKWA